MTTLLLFTAYKCQLSISRIKFTLGGDFVDMGLISLCSLEFNSNCFSAAVSL
ncbi:hypothetical protein AVEN_146844-1, partial [Araneus ventricosus]